MPLLPGSAIFYKTKDNRPGTATTPHHPEDCRPMTRGQAMPASSRLRSLKARRYPPDCRSGLHPAQIQEARARVLGPIGGSCVNLVFNLLRHLGQGCHQ
jgi:hypothetical protein